jgi:hypothetical protein
VNKLRLGTNRLTPGANHVISPNVARVPTCNTSQGRLERGGPLCFEIQFGWRQMACNVGRLARARITVVT